MSVPGHEIRPSLHGNDRASVAPTTRPAGEKRAAPVLLAGEPLSRALPRKTDEVWWAGPDDPNVCLLQIAPLTAELWDGPASALVTAFEFAKAKLTGEQPNLGENRKVTVKM